MLVERYQTFRNARLISKVDEIFAALLLLDFASAGKQLFQRSIGVDQLCARLHANSRNARHIVGAVTRQGLHIDHLVRCDTEFLQHLRIADHLLFAGIKNFHAGLDKLHHVFVRRDNPHRRPCRRRLPCVSSDQIIRFIVEHFDGRQIERPRGLADQPKLRAHVGWRLWPVGFVFGIKVIAERLG